MPLIAFWKASPDAVGHLRVEQVVAAAGDGNLLDKSVCSSEIREYFSQVSSEKLSEYAVQCLVSKFDKSGLVLQDIINELGRRLDYKTENGLYQGHVGGLGCDGIWLAPENNCIIAEVKTTDAYRISLDRLIEYREKARALKSLNSLPTLLIIVGRQDTGELEAQIRGSRHAWDIRLISVEALCKLVKLKESSEDTETGRKIRGILMPLEYTRLDGLVDVLFTAAKETSSEISEDVGSASDIVSTKTRVLNAEETEASPYRFTDAKLLQDKREAIINAASKKWSRPFLRKSQALFWDHKHERRFSCTLSKLYERKGFSYLYWYAYHPKWNEFLSEATEGFLILGCMDLDVAFAIPHKTIQSFLPNLNTTVSERGTYWHLHIAQLGDDSYSLIAAKGGSGLRLNEFELSLTE